MEHYKIKAFDSAFLEKWFPLVPLWTMLCDLCFEVMCYYRLLYGGYILKFLVLQVTEVEVKGSTRGTNS